MMLGFVPLPNLQISDRANINPDEDAIDPDNWKDYVVSVQILEESLGTTEYDFLSNVPVEIQDIIEERDRNEILAWIDDHELSSSLLAEIEPNSINSNTIVTNATIRHDSFVENSVFNTHFVKPFNPTQIGVTEINFVEADLTKSGVSENRSGQIDVVESNLSKFGTRKVNPFHITVPEIAFIHTNATKISEAQIDFNERRTIEVSPIEVSFPVYSSFNGSISQPSTSPSSKILFASSVQHDFYATTPWKTRY